MTLAELNDLSPSGAEAAFVRCCGSVRWAHAMAAARPFSSLDVLLVSGERVWWSLEAADWLEAFAAHPRIGEKATSPWSADEQSGVSSAGQALRDQLAAGNLQYEARFGYTFLVCATGRSAADIQTALSRRLLNAPDDELQIAAGEQRRITELRLHKLVTS